MLTFEPFMVTGASGCIAGMHDMRDRYYTSDYDLSGFYSLEAGAGIRVLSMQKFFKGWTFDEVDLKYTFFWRSDGLKAHFMSTYFGVGNTK